MQDTQLNTIKNFLQNITTINQTDTRQQGKTKYKLNELVTMALIATIGNANDFVEIGRFTKKHKQTLQAFIPLKQVPSHDTIYRAFAMIENEYFENLKKDFNKLLNTDEGEKFLKLFNIDGKTQCGAQT
ncbi:MAG: transposase family protein [Candidatus Bathyarchaeota archaeon]|nr:transposase family protein [Candidatus Termiticorpusculum sp.]